jgi:hypothetical protein
MRNYEFIREAYTRVEKCYIKMTDEAVENKNNIEYQKIQELSRINEYAYFVLFWGQFETYINDKALDLEGEYYMSMGFMLRVQTQISLTHELYTEIDKYYEWRCALAHGNHFHFPELTLSTIFDKIEEIVERIDKGDPTLLADDFGDIFKD